MKDLRKKVSKIGWNHTIRKYVDGVRYNGYLIYSSNKWYSINNTRRLCTCTAEGWIYCIAPESLKLSTSLAILSSSGSGEAASLLAAAGERVLLVSTHWAGCTSVVHCCTHQERSPLGENRWQRSSSSEHPSPRNIWTGNWNNLTGTRNWRDCPRCHDNGSGICCQRRHHRRQQDWLDRVVASSQCFWFHLATLWLDWTSWFQFLLNN